MRPKALRSVRPPDISIAHTFRPSPYGGSNQFLLALREELRRRGLRVAEYGVTSRTRACILNSFAFDVDAVRRTMHPRCRVLHRVDGPVAAYRGFDDGADKRVVEINEELASATIFQSRYSLEAHRAVGLALREPIVIPNAVDPSIFHPPTRMHSPVRRKVRLIATSWSDNPNKGFATLAWLDRELDPHRYELTFAGRAPIAFANVRVVGPLPSHELAKLLRSQDLYLAASVNDPASNALLEGLACGLPALYRRSGGHPELVGAGGLPFEEDEEVPELLEQIVDELDEHRAAIRIPTLADVADRYLEAMVA
jgi:glycosyltransferase involved in cell wall biosynthesis